MGPPAANAGARIGSGGGDGGGGDGGDGAALEEDLWARRDEALRALLPSANVSAKMLADVLAAARPEQASTVRTRGFVLWLPAPSCPRLYCTVHLWQHRHVFLL